MYESLSYVVRGRVRLKIIKNLNKPMTPTQIANLIKNHRSTVSRTLISMKEKGLVTCLNPKQKTGRLYQLTKSGKKVLTQL